MKTMIKAFWLVIALLTMNACRKHKTDEIVTPPELNKAVFISDAEGGYYAINATNGVGLWNYNTPGGGYSYWSSAAVNKNTTVFRSYSDNKMFALGTISGSLLWTKEDNYYSSLLSPLIYKDIVYYVANGKISGYNLSDGSLAAEYAVEGTYINSTNSINIAKNMFVLATCGGHLYGVNSSGTKVWEYISNNGCYHNNPAIADGIIYILSSGGKLSAVKLDDGTELWNRMLTGYTYNASVIYNKGLLFIPGYETEKIYAFNAANGDLKHTYNLPAGEKIYYYMTPAVNGDNMYALTTGGSLMAYSVENENVLWQKTYSLQGAGRKTGVTMPHNKVESSDAVSSVVYANNMLFFAVGKSVYAVDLKGTQQWQFNTSNYIYYTSPVILSTYDKAYRAASAGIAD
jgi:outer membrane protein assembly factor BamB